MVKKGGPARKLPGLFSMRGRNRRVCGQESQRIPQIVKGGVRDNPGAAIVGCNFISRSDAWQ